jgi:hypothetical protein
MLNSVGFFLAGNPRLEPCEPVEASRRSEMSHHAAFRSILKSPCLNNLGFYWLEILVRTLPSGRSWIRRGVAALRLVPLTQRS